MIYEFQCSNSTHPTQEFWSSMAERDRIVAKCARCGAKMHRLPGGHGLLYFEEGRSRSHSALSSKPISSHGEHARLMRKLGAEQCNGQVPQGILKAGPKTRAMKEYLSKDRKGTWI